MHLPNWIDGALLMKLILFLADDDVVPGSFPGVVSITPNETGEPLLNKDYRKFGKEEFEYFIVHLLSRTQPKRTKYNNQTRPNKSVSECFTPSDEAFAVLVLDNELHVWKQQLRLEKHGKRTMKEMRLAKKYTKGYTNKKDAKCGWSRDGMSHYNQLRTEIRKLRQETVLTEQKYMQKFRSDGNWEAIGNQDNHDDCQGDDYEDFVIDEEDQLEDVSQWVLKQHRRSGERIDMQTV